MATAGGGDKHFPTESGGCCRAREVSGPGERRKLQVDRGTRLHPQRRTATSTPKTAAAFPVETVGTLPIPVYFMRSVGSTVAVFFWKTPTRQRGMAGHHFSRVYLVTSSRRCVQHAPCRRIVGEEMAPIRTRLLSGCHEDAIHEQADRYWIQRPCRRALVRLDLQLRLLQLRAVL